jgi:hypothetical protein
MGRIFLGTSAGAGNSPSTGNRNGVNLMASHPHRKSGPLIGAVIVAVVGLLALLIVDHGPWNKPHVQTRDSHNYATTAEAAHAVGATVTPTAPKADIEPVAPGPKPAQPANPAS